MAIYDYIEITNHVIYLYNQLTETSDKCNFKQNYVLGGKVHFAS